MSGTIALVALAAWLVPAALVALVAVLVKTITPRVVVVQAAQATPPGAPDAADDEEDLGPPVAGDIVDILGTPCFGHVVCVDNGIAWCRFGRDNAIWTDDGWMIYSHDIPRPVPVGGVRVVERGIPILAPTN